MKSLHKRWIPSSEITPFPILLPSSSSLYYGSRSTLIFHPFSSSFHNFKLISQPFSQSMHSNRAHSYIPLLFMLSPSILRNSFSLFPFQSQIVIYSGMTAKLSLISISNRLSSLLFLPPVNLIPSNDTTVSLFFPISPWIISYCLWSIYPLHFMLMRCFTVLPLEFEGNVRSQTIRQSEWSCEIERVSQLPSEANDHPSLVTSWVTSCWVRERGIDKIFLSGRFPLDYKLHSIGRRGVVRERKRCPKVKSTLSSR